MNVTITFTPEATKSVISALKQSASRYGTNPGEDAQRVLDAIVMLENASIRTKEWSICTISGTAHALAKSMALNRNWSQRMRAQTEKDLERLAGDLETIHNIAVDLYQRDRTK